MRFVEVRLHPTEGVFHPIEEEYIASPGLERRAIQQFAVNEDDTIVMMYVLEGDPEAAREILEARPEVISYDIMVSGSRVLAYVHFESGGVAANLFGFLESNQVLVDLPMRYVEVRGRAHKALDVTAVGDVEAIQCAAGKVPDGVRVEMVRTGDYEPDYDRIARGLTERQRAVLEAAVEVGYYNVPRGGSLGDVAEEVGLSPSTVSEHLQKIAAHVLKQVADP